LITIKHNTVTHEFKTLDEAITWAKELGKFVTIQFDGMEVSGKFGADDIIDGKLPNGEAYKWKKRRKQ
jgi:sugar phosphate isomerase/epimerase